MKRKIIGAMFAAFLLAACKKDYVAQVGGTAITRKDLETRKKVSELYYPGSGKDYVALAQLIQSYLAEEVLRSLGYKLDAAAWEQEAKRIDENTRAPDTLKKIKDIYGLDRDEYIKTFIRPVYAERYLYNEVFLKNPEIQKNQLESAQKFIAEALNQPSDFSRLVTQKNLQSSRLRLSKKTGIAPFDERKLKPANLDNPEPAGMEQAQILIAKLAGLKPGEVCPQLIEWPEGYQVLKFLKKDGQDYIVESVSIPKRPFDDWFWEKASQVPVKLNDRLLKEELLKNVTWAARLNFK
jgi:hypothetical protein